jgi:hypothetical protein
VHLLHVAGLLALEPQLPARAAEVHGAAQFGGLRSASRSIQANISTSPVDCFLRDDGHEALARPI